MVSERETPPTVTNWGEKGTAADASRNMDCSSEAVIKLTCLGLCEFFQSFQGPCQQLKYLKRSHDQCKDCLGTRAPQRAATPSTCLTRQRSKTPLSVSSWPWSSCWPLFPFSRLCPHPTPDPHRRTERDLHCPLPTLPPNPIPTDSSFVKPIPRLNHLQTFFLF